MRPQAPNARQQSAPRPAPNATRQLARQQSAPRPVRQRPASLLARQPACLLLLFVLLLPACGASRRAVKTQSATVSMQNASGTTIRTDTASVLRLTAEADRHDEEVVTRIVEYDTSLPTDPATGTPPLKRTITRTRRTAAEHRLTVAAAEQVSSKQLTDTTATVRTETLTASDAHSRRGMNLWQRALCLAGLLALAALALRAAFRGR